MLRLSPERGERLEIADTLDFRTVGAESNVAIAANRLGTDTTWISKLPDSALGRRVRNDVRRHGVIPDIVWIETGRQGTYYLEQGKTPRGTNVIYDRTEPSVTTTEPAEIAIEAIDAAEVFFTTRITPALSDTLFDTTRELLATDTTTRFDLNYRSKLRSEDVAGKAYEELLPEVDLLFVPKRDVRSVLGLKGDAAALVDQLQSRYDCEIVVLTQGAEGVLASTPNGLVEHSAFEIETHDPIGTGDAFVGTFLSRYVAGEPAETALRYGAATAAFKRTIGGDLAVVTEAEVENVIEQRSRETDRKRPERIVAAVCFNVFFLLLRHPPG